MVNFTPRVWSDGEFVYASDLDDLETRVSRSSSGPSLYTSLGKIPTGEQYISSFQSGHGFTNGSGGTGTLSVGTSSPGLGTQYLRCVTAGTGTVCRPTSPTINPAVNLTDKHFRFMLRIDKPTQVTLPGLSLYVTSDATSWTNFALASFLPNLADRAPYWAPNEWASMVLDRGAFTVTGTVDWTSIKQVRLAINDTVAGGPVTVDWQLISTVPAPSQGTVTFTVDDGFATNQTIMRPRLDRYGMPATLAIIAERAIRADAGQDSSSLTTAQIRSLVYNSGWEVVPHAYTGAMHDNAPNRYTAYSDGEVAEDWLKLQSWLASNGLGGPTLQQFCWPGGQFNTEKMALARRFFAATTITFPGHNSLAYVDPMRISRINTAGPGRLAFLKTAIDRCIAHKTWLVLMLHDFIETGTPSGIQMNRADWEELVDYVHSSGVRVRTVGDVLVNG